MNNYRTTFVQDVSTYWVKTESITVTFVATMAVKSWKGVVEWASTHLLNLLVSPAGTWSYPILGARSISTPNMF